MFQCNSPDHVANDCEMRDNRRCFKCNGCGHIARNCKSNVMQSHIVAGFEGQCSSDVAKDTDKSQIDTRICNCGGHENPKSAEFCMLDVEAEVEDCIKDG